MVDELISTPTKYGQRLYYTGFKNRSLTDNLKHGFDEIADFTNGNKIRVIDACEYASTATAAAAWVATDTVATTGIVVTKGESIYVVGSSAVLFTTGTSTYAADVTVTKSLTADISTYPEDIYGKGYQNWSGYNYIGWWEYAGEAHAATDVDLIITDAGGNTATASLGAVDTNHATKYFYRDVAFSEMTGTIDWERVASISLMFDDGMGTSETTTIDQIIVYKYSNGKGPVFGNMKKYLAGEASMVRGMIIKQTSNAIPTVVSANDGDTGIVGISCSDGDAGDVMFVQVDGPALAECGALTSLEVGDGLGCADNGGLYVTECASTMADSFAKYHLVAKSTAGQYEIIWIMLGDSGAAPS